LGGEMSRLRISLAAAVLTVFSYPLLAQDAQIDPAANAIRKGDQWTYNDIDDITGKKKATVTFTVTEANDKQIAVRSVREGRDEPGFSVYDLNWNATIVGVWKKLPRDSTGIEPPLVVGKEWSFKHRNQNTSTGAVLNVTTKAKVVGQETAKVASQEYDTFKIETQIHQVPQNGRSQDILIVTWYAPAINRWVKRSWTIRSEGHVKDQHTHELVEFSRGK
jgi:hypothetical protein